MAPDSPAAPRTASLVGTVTLVAGSVVLILVGAVVLSHRDWDSTTA